MPAQLDLLVNGQRQIQTINLFLQILKREKIASKAGLITIYSKKKQTHEIVVKKALCLLPASLTDCPHSGFGNARVN
jgi:hypothetical protein